MKCVYSLLDRPRASCLLVCAVLTCRCPTAALLQNQLHDVARFKPMTATATTMVKSIWQSYFRPAGAKPEEEAEQPTAKVGRPLGMAADARGSPGRYFIRCSTGRACLGSRLPCVPAADSDVACCSPARHFSCLPLSGSSTLLLAAAWPGRLSLLPATVWPGAVQEVEEDENEEEAEDDVQEEALAQVGASWRGPAPRCTPSGHSACPPRTACLLNDRPTKCIAFHH